MGGSMAMSLALLHTSARISLAQFTVHPSTVIGIVGLAGLYEYGARKAVGDGRSALSVGGDHHRRPTPSTHRFLFHGGLVIMFFSLNGWLHDLSDSYLFSAHMVQHLM